MGAPSLLAVLLVVSLAWGGAPVFFQESLEALQAFDATLMALVQQVVTMEKDAVETPSSVMLAQIARSYWERDARWQQGGTVEALKYMTRANDLTPTTKPREKFSWTLQQGILESALGHLSEAKETLRAALALSGNDANRASVLFHTSSLLLLHGSMEDRQQSHAHLFQSIKLDPCGLEAPKARLLLVQSYALLDEATPEGWRGIIKFLEDELAQNRCGGHAIEAKVSQAGTSTSSTSSSRSSSRSSSSSSDALQPLSSALVHRADLHRALFIAEDAVAQNRSKAWFNLQQANHLDAERLSTSGKLPAGRSLQASTEELQIILQTGFLPPAELKVGSKSRLPTFIVGFLRSGSTLLETMLDAHPYVFGLGEVSAVPFQINQLEAELMRRQKVAVARRESFSDEYRLIVAKHADKLLHFMKMRAKSGSGKKKRVRRIIDKTPRNCRNLAQIFLLFPNATVIHITRQPMDTLFSCYKHRFDSASVGYTLDEASLVQEYSLYLRVMEHWRDTLPPGSILEIAYEDLACRPEDTMRVVLQRMGLPWDDAVLRYHEKARVGVRTASALQVREKLDSGGIGAFKPYERFLGKMIASLEMYANMTVGDTIVGCQE